ncbi:DJ-1/PfpI family protein [candidate division KSB1 bacterium]|nr:DJ-1/PfpI family protein [candidate division KSB1 bacterium]NIR72377.1 DJ-1/PfpI family protein [candidate division KSB1 bacterium]NIS23563.1 DJ-1/PfpI family protein [candidate division KSB1 bacterium]NIT70492.1 DJ-1/PfpI family protein [candidate division KSB1 bacterium]NIU24197.1 DJ-1/PfpI family protein [candidate division KSB1 bacterium]
MKLVDKASVAQQQMRHAAKTERKKVAVLVFPGVQIIDFTGPWEVFGQAGFEVFTVAQESGPITTTFGMSLNPDYNFNNCPKPDFILVPGGNVLKTQSDPEVKTWLHQNTEEANMVLSVCNGAFILAKSGLLEGLKATTTRSLVDGLAAAAPNIEVVRDTRFVDNGKIITSGGLSAGIDAALHLVSKVYGRKRAERIARGLEYEWHSDGLLVEN